MDSDDKFAISPLVIVCATVFGMACSLVSCDKDINGAIDAANGAIEDTNRAIEDTNEQIARGSSPAIEHANGCSLDAVAYDAPAFADHDSNVLKVTDRFSGASWWLVKMGTEWVVLPIESSKEES